MTDTKTKTHPAPVRAKARKLGGVVAKLGKLDDLTTERNDLIRELSADGMTYREIAEITGLSHQGVGLIVKAAA